MNYTASFYMQDCYGYGNRCQSTGSSSSTISTTSTSLSSPSAISNYSLSPPPSSDSRTSGYIPNYQMVPQNQYLIQPPPQSYPQAFDVNYQQQYLENFQIEQSPTESFDIYLAPSVEPFSDVDLSELYEALPTNPQNFYAPLFETRTKKGKSGRPRIYSEQEKHQRKIESAKKSRDKKKEETKQLFERVNEMKMFVETLKCTEYQFQACFNDLLTLTSQHLFQNKL